ncbi:MAG: hypothetical protein NVSMB33_08900 [Ktedonobacteraceae bacterium]
MILFTLTLVWYTTAMTAEERIAWLEEQLQQALREVQALQEQLTAAKLRIEE